MTLKRQFGWMALYSVDWWVNSNSKFFIIWSRSVNEEPFAFMLCCYILLHFYPVRCEGRKFSFSKDIKISTWEIISICSRLISPSLKVYLVRYSFYYVAIFREVVYYCLIRLTYQNCSSMNLINGSIVYLKSDGCKQNICVTWYLYGKESWTFTTQRLILNRYWLFSLRLKVNCIWVS